MNSDAIVPPGRSGLPVLTYLVLAFGSSVAALLALVASTSMASFRTEHHRVAISLRAAAQVADDRLADSRGQTLGYLASMAAQPSVTALDPTRCDTAFGGVAAVVASYGHLHLFDGAGTEICSLVPKGLVGSLSAADWQPPPTERNQPWVSSPRPDPLSGRISTVAAIPIHGPAGRAGTLVAVVFTGSWPITVPGDVPRQTTMVALDAGRTVVLQASDGAGRLVGRSLAGTGLERALPASGSTIAGFDHSARFAVEVTGPDGEHVVALLPAGAVMHAAWGQLGRNLSVGGIGALLLAGLGFLLHRRLARPMRRITAAIRAAGSGRDEVWAPVEGPEELGEMAEAFNGMLAERRAREADLRHRANHDVLTGLPNRAALTEALSATLAAGRRAAVLFLDLDRFKLVNDSHGHAIGDALLVALGRRLLAAVRPGDVVARFGGDEFVVLCPGVDELGAVEIAQRFARMFEGAFLVDGHELFLTGSVGAAIGEPMDRPDDLLRDADNAMYRAKEQGRPGYAFFDQRMRECSQRRLELEQELHVALERGELRLEYQPVFELHSGAVAGAEALLRWDNPLRGPVSPAEFIPIAEETGLVIPVGDWVLRQALRQAAAWRSEFRRGVRVSVNIAARQLTRPGLAAQVLVALGEAGADPGDLMLEITEHGVLEDFAAAFRHLQEVRALGVRVSVDDFGTGWSSLSYLQRLPVDELKIDRSFIATLGVDGPSMAIVGSLVAMAHGLGLRVVAEGIETGDQLAELRRLGCDVGQGFLLSRPSRPETLRGLLSGFVPTPS
ncbi:MAG TPA: EAL domain-containing protein [Acidimicrobiia bacterium]|nr:EAL domain-containing protein [Acidimicrobiia bacterium]